MFEEDGVPNGDKGEDQTDCQRDDQNDDKYLLMLASSVTMHDMRVTIHSIIELVKSIIKYFPHVLTEEFGQHILR